MTIVEPVCNLPNRVPMLRKAQNLERPRHWTCIWSRSACRCNCFLLTSEMRKVKPHCHPCTGQYIHIYCNHIIYIYTCTYTFIILPWETQTNLRKSVPLRLGARNGRQICALVMHTDRLIAVDLTKNISLSQPNLPLSLSLSVGLDSFLSYRDTL